MIKSTSNNLQHLEEILQGFTPISLAEMDAVKLMNREDTKLVVPLDQLNEIMKQLADDYSVLCIKNHRISTYSSLYYDTADKEAFRLHHNGKLNRYKFRYRSYIESGISFFEIKHKSNKGRTIKKRIPKPNILVALDAEDKRHVADFTPLAHVVLEPSIWIYFKRITLVSKTDEERLTIDLQLSFKNNTTNEIIEAPGMAIFEVKQPRFSRNSSAISILHQCKIYPIRVSKYCLGIISCFEDQVKKNKFKKKIFQLAKITSNEYYRTLFAH